MERTLRHAEQYCERALPRVSRTFALNIRILPQPLRAVVRQAYLLCRIADTVEDSPHLPAGDRPPPCLPPTALRSKPVSKK